MMNVSYWERYWVTFIVLTLNVKAGALYEAGLSSVYLCVVESKCVVIRRTHLVDYTLPLRLWILST